MGIGTLSTVVIDVGDLAIGERFWSEVTGLVVLSSGYGDRFSWLGTADPRRAEIVLQARSDQKTGSANRCHLDITPTEGIDLAIAGIIDIGGNLKKGPTIYPRPGSIPGKRPLIDWAVMCDPFGNEFCLIDDLTREQSDAVLAAAERGVGADHGLRVAAGVTS